jgi:hypothetical protein
MVNVPPSSSSGGRVLSWAIATGETAADVAARQRGPTSGAVVTGETAEDALGTAHATTRRTDRTDEAVVGGDGDADIAVVAVDNVIVADFGVDLGELIEGIGGGFDEEGHPTEFGIVLFLEWLAVGLAQIRYRRHVNFVERSQERGVAFGLYQTPGDGTAPEAHADGLFGAVWGVGVLLGRGGSGQGRGNGSGCGRAAARPYQRGGRGRRLGGSLALQGDGRDGRIGRTRQRLVPTNDAETAEDALGTAHATTGRQGRRPVALVA